jgi:hypothetical protein
MVYRFKRQAVNRSVKPGMGFKMANGFQGVKLLFSVHEER